MANILQENLLTNFLYPFLLIFFITFAILGKSKLFGEKNEQLNAFVSLVVGLIFVSAAGYVGFASDMILFMTVGIIVIFVGLIFWGFISGGEFKLAEGKPLTKFFGIATIIAVIVAVIVFTSSGTPAWNWLQGAFDWIFRSEGSSGFWTNFLTVFIVVGAVVAVIKAGGGAGGKSK